MEKPDGPLAPDEEARVARLTEPDMAQIDQALLSKAGPKWRKVAFVVGSAMTDLPKRIPGIPDVFYARRVKKLIERGLLEAQGDLDRMRHSEVRLSSSSCGKSENQK